MPTKKVVLNLEGAGVQVQQRASSAVSRCGNMVVLPGYGEKDFKFPGVGELVNNTLARLKSKSVVEVEEKEGEVRAGRRRHDRPSGSGNALVNQLDQSFAPSFPARGRVPSPPSQVPPVLDVTSVPSSAAASPILHKVESVDATLFAATEGIRLILHKGRFDAIVAERFDPLAGSVNWACEHLDAKYQPAISSLSLQLTNLQNLYKASLPRVLAVLAAQNPDVSGQALLGSAVDSLDQEMVRILTVLRIWTDAFGQLRDGMYKQLQAVVFTVEQAFKLFETGDLEGSCKGLASCAPKMKTSVFNIGNVFVARFSPQGPATLPGTRGPVGAHAIEVPHDERNIITLMLVLYAHEFRHDIFADVEGLARELTQAVIGAVLREWQLGNLKFSADKIAIGRTRLPAVELIAKFFADTIGEVDADINGGVQLCGYSFAYNMVSTFGALNSRGRSVFDNPQLLRTGSYYQFEEVDGKLALQFEPHPPDYIRAYICAAALDEIGFAEQAAEVRRLANQAVGVVPEFITWEDMEGKSKQVIKIPVSDLKLAAPIVVRALMHSKLEALGGSSCAEVVNWDERRQEKVDMLRTNLVNGLSDVPDTVGDFFATYVAAAASLAYWDLCKLGVRPMQAAASVEENALKMLDIVRQRLSQPPIAPKIDAACSCEQDKS